MMKNVICTFCAMVILNFTLFYSQANSCPNVDVSQLNFNNWSGFTGTYYAPGTNFGIVNGRHTIITQQGLDPNTCNQLNMIPQGHTQAIKLGNASVGAESEQLTYAINVTPQSSLFIYKYAVVLENPGHSPTQQPKFETKILNTLGLPIGGACGTYTVYGGQPGQNFQQRGSRTWLPWTTVGLDLTPYMGQTIQIEFTTWDCAQGAHFGYAYLAAECLPLSIDVNFCGGNQPLTLTAPSGFQSYSWQPGNMNGQQVTVNNPQTNQIYTCTMTTFSNQGTCSVDLSVQATPTLVQASFTYSFGCENEPINFQSTSTLVTANPAVSLSYQWSFNNGFPSQSTISNPVSNFNANANPVVQLIANSSNGCSDTITQVISLLALPHLSANIDAPCINQQSVYQIGGSNSLQQVVWDFGDNTPPANNFTGIHVFGQAGTYNSTIIGIGNNGCIDTLNLPIIIHPLPNIFAGNDTSFCPGNDIMLQAQGGINYSWSNGMIQGGVYSINQTSTFLVSGMDTMNCWATDSIQINVFNVSMVNAMPDTLFCFGDSIQLSAQACDSIWWENGISNNQWISNSVGTYTYTVHGIDSNGCASIDSVNITCSPLPQTWAGNDTIVCTGTFAFLNASGAYTYTWSNGLQNGNSTIITGNQDFWVIGTSNLGCVSVDSIHVGIDSIPLIQASISPQSGCIPLNVEASNLSTGNVFSQLQWVSEDGQIAYGDSVDFTFDEVGCFDINLTATSMIGCVYSQNFNQVVCTYPLPDASFNLPQEPLTTVYNGGQFSNMSSGANGYHWDFGDGMGFSNDENPYYNFPNQNAGEYQVILIAYNAYGCTDTAIQIIALNNELSFYVPNAFTPDGNEFNNVWKPVFSEGLDPMNYHASVYNRWGEIIWESYNHEIGWDGTYGKNALPVQDDIYTYQIQFAYLDSAEKKMISGHIVVIK